MKMIKLLWQILVDEFGKIFAFRNSIHEDISYSMLENNAKIVLTDITISHLGNIDRKHFHQKNRRNYKMLMAEIQSGKAHQLTYFHLINTLMIFGGQKNLKQAIKYIDYSFDNFDLKPTDPIVPKMRILRGLCCMNLFDKTKDLRLREAARVDFNTSYAQKKGSEAAVNIAEILMQEQKWDETIAILEENYTNIDSEHPRNMPFDYKNIYLLLLFKLGDCYCHKKIWDKAEKYYKEFIGINSNSLEAIDRLIQVLRNMRKSNEATLITVMAVNRWPMYFVGWSNLGQFELENNRLITARVFFKEALRINPKHKESLFNLKKIDEYFKRKK